MQALHCRGNIRKYSYKVFYIFSKLQGCDLKFEFSTSSKDFTFFTACQQFKSILMKSYEEMIRIQFEHLLWSIFFLKLQGNCLKFKVATPFSILSLDILKSAW